MQDENEGLLRRVIASAGRAKAATEAMQRSTDKLVAAESEILRRALEAVRDVAPALVSVHRLDRRAYEVEQTEFRGIIVARVGTAGRAHELYLAVGPPGSAREAVVWLEVQPGAYVYYLEPEEIVQSVPGRRHRYDLADILRSLLTACETQASARGVHAKGRAARAETLAQLALAWKVSR